MLSRTSCSICRDSKSCSLACFRPVISSTTAMIPVMLPRLSRKGAVEREISMGEPSFFRRVISTPEKPSPFITRSRSIQNSSNLSSGTKGRNLPNVSSSVQPNTRSAAGFHNVTVPSGDSAKIGSGEASMSACSFAKVSRNSSSAFFWAVTSSNRPSTYAKFSWSSYNSWRLSESQRTVPSLCTARYSTRRILSPLRTASRKRSFTCCRSSGWIRSRHFALPFMNSSEV